MNGTTSLTRLPRPRQITERTRDSMFGSGQEKASEVILSLEELSKLMVGRDSTERGTLEQS